MDISPRVVRLVGILLLLVSGKNWKCFIFSDCSKVSIKGDKEINLSISASWEWM